MNKTPEQIAEEMYGQGHMNQMDWEKYRKPQYDACIKGYHYRDSEIEKLVEVLREVTDKYHSGADMFAESISKAKEALKPYITKTEIE